MVSRRNFSSYPTFINSQDIKSLWLLIELLVFGDMEGFIKIF